MITSAFIWLLQFKLYKQQSNSKLSAIWLKGKIVAKQVGQNREFGLHFKFTRSSAVTAVHFRCSKAKQIYKQAKLDTR